MNILAYSWVLYLVALKSIGHLYCMELTEPFLFSFLSSLQKKWWIYGAWISSLIWNALRNSHITVGLVFACSAAPEQSNSDNLYFIPGRERIFTLMHFFVLGDVQTFLIGEPSQVTPKRSKQSLCPFYHPFQSRPKHSLIYGS